LRATGAIATFCSIGTIISEHDTLALIWLQRPTVWSFVYLVALSSVVIALAALFVDRKHDVTVDLDEAKLIKSRRMTFGKKLLLIYVTVNFFGTAFIVFWKIVSWLWHR
jgi:hypothetical protein